MCHNECVCDVLGEIVEDGEYSPDDTANSAGFAINDTSDILTMKCNYLLAL